jgi:malate synthase
MEDVATAEISRSQIWQWLHHGRASADDVLRIEREQMERLGDDYAGGREVFQEVALSTDFVEFLTYPAYERLD